MEVANSKWGEQLYHVGPQLKVNTKYCKIQEHMNLNTSDSLPWLLGLGSFSSFELPITMSWGVIGNDSWNSLNKVKAKQNTIRNTTENKFTNQD